jgi:transcription antitermination factor NusG
MPLFPGYVFMRGTIGEAYMADRTRRVAGIMRVADQQRLQWELSNLRLALSNGSPFEPHPWLQSGVRVEVRAGPFRGLQGIVESRTRSDRLILQVRMLGCATSMEIDAALLDILD